MRRLATGLRGTELYSPTHPLVQRGIDALAAAATERAFALVTGVDDRVPLDEHDDLARLAAGRLGTPALTALAARARVPARRAELLGAAWEAGGREALAVSDGDAVEPAPPWAVAEARVALEAADPDATAVRVQGNRVTKGAVQLRWAPSGRWYRFDKFAGRWEIAGLPAADPTELC